MSILKEKKLSGKNISPDHIEQVVGNLSEDKDGEHISDAHKIDKIPSSDINPRPPMEPKTIEDTGLRASFIIDLFMKHAYFMGDFSLQEVSNRIKLPVALLDKVVETLRTEHFLEVKGAGNLLRTSFRYSVTDKGINRARYLLEQSRYIGPAPVNMIDYRKMVQSQTVKGIRIDPDDINDSFSHLVIDGKLKDKIGPAVHSGKSIFIFGPSGNGKTAIAEAIGSMLPGHIYIPYAFTVGNEIITVYDRGIHKKAVHDNLSGSIDDRWIYIKRPVVMVGGEFTLKLLDLKFNNVSRFYEAPLQIKANNGVFILDDFGRQSENPTALLNRYIIPLDRRIDFLSLHTGMQLEVPFDQLVIFTTNIEPRELMDEVYLRRIPYKIKIDTPSREEYEAIFKLECMTHGLVFKEDVFNYLMIQFYQKLRLSFTACHPRDLLNHIIDISSYKGVTAELTNDSIFAACESYFVDL